MLESSPGLRGGETASKSGPPSFNTANRSRQGSGEVAISSSSSMPLPLTPPLPNDVAAPAKIGPIGTEPSARRLAAEAVRVASTKLQRAALGGGVALVGAARNVLPHCKSGRGRTQGDAADPAPPGSSKTALPRVSGRAASQGMAESDLISFEEG